MDGDGHGGIISRFDEGGCQDVFDFEFFKLVKPDFVARDIDGFIWNHHPGIQIWSVFKGDDGGHDFGEGGNGKGSLSIVLKKNLAGIQIHDGCSFDIKLGGDCDLHEREGSGGDVELKISQRRGCGDLGQEDGFEEEVEHLFGL